MSKPTNVRIEIEIEDYLKPLESFAPSLAGQLRAKCTENNVYVIAIEAEAPVIVKREVREVL